MTPPESTKPRTAAQMDNEELIDTMILLDRQAQYSFRSGGNEYKQINADVERLHAELRRRLATIAPAEPGRVVITLDAARAALSAMPKVEQYTTEFQWKTRVNPHYRELEAAIDAAAERAATGGA